MMLGDLQFVLRRARRRLLPTSGAIFALAVAIGLSTSTFAILNASLLRPMRIDNPATSFHLSRFKGVTGTSWWTMSDYALLKTSAKSVHLEAWRVSAVPLAGHLGNRQADNARMHFVSQSFLQTFGAVASRGRLLGEEDYAPAAQPVTVLNHRYWIRHLRGDEAIVGKEIYLGQVQVRVVGVAGPSFDGPALLRDPPAAFWLPLNKMSALVPDAPGFSNGRPERVWVIGALAEPRSWHTANAELDVLVRHLSSDASQTRVRLLPVEAPLSDESRLTVAAVLTAIAIIVLVAALNVGNLLLALAIQRRSEFAIRTALGARRWQLFRLVLLESCLWGATAGIVGLLVASWVTPTIAHLVWIPLTVAVSIDAETVVFGICASTAAGVLAGWFAARKAFSERLTSNGIAGMASASGGNGRQRGLFMLVQAGTSVMLIALMAVCCRSLLAISAFANDVALDRFLVATVSPREADAALPKRPIHPALVAVLEQARRLDGIASATFVSDVPFSGGFKPIYGHSGNPEPVARQTTTTAEYFQVLDLKARRGRFYTADEVRQGAPVAVVSEALASKFWSIESPIGASLSKVSPSLAGFVVIGVTDGHVAKLADEGALVFRPMLDPSERGRILLRLSTKQATAAQSLEAVLQAAAPERNVTVRPISDRFARNAVLPRTAAVVSAGLAIVALAISLVGLMSQTGVVVHERSAEIGVRVALGATGRQVRLLVLKDVLTPVAAGGLIGGVLSLPATEALAGLMFGVPEHGDPVAFAVSLLALLMSATVVSLCVLRGFLGFDLRRLISTN